MNFRIFLIIFFSFVSIFSIRAKQNTQEIFLKANEFYKKGDFKAAYRLYKKIIPAGMKVNYNLGNCAFQLGKNGYAMLYWKRAEKDSGFFNRSELLENINYLKRQLFGQSDKEDRLLDSLNFYKNYFLSLLRSAPLFGVQVLFLIFWIICFFYIRYLFKQNRTFLISISFFIIASLGFILVMRYNLDFKHYGIIVSEQAKILSGPGNSFKVLSVLPETSQVKIQKSSDNYYKIKFQRLVGWINKKYVEKI